MKTQAISNYSTTQNSKLKELFAEQLQDIYWAEKKLVQTLNYTEAKNLVSQTLNEEKAADEKLTRIAKSGINYKARREPDNN